MNIINKEISKIIDVLEIFKEKANLFDNRSILCIFDMDNTITYTKAPAVYWPNVKKYKDVYDEIIEKYKDIDDGLAYINILTSHDVCIFDDDIYKVINGIKCKKITLTASITGPFKGIGKIEHFRYNILKKLNICFENEFNLKHEVFDNFEKYLNSYPTFYNGILSSNSEKGTTNKGEVLCKFLEKVNFNPKCIIFVDDNKRNHENVEKELKKTFVDLELVNILYTGTYNFVPEDISQKEFKEFWEKQMECAKNIKKERKELN